MRHCPPQIIVCGSELFTGNTALCFTAWLEGKVKFGQVLKNWVRDCRGLCGQVCAFKCVGQPGG